MKRAEYPLSTRPGNSKAKDAAGGPATIRELLSFKLHVVANLLSRGAALRYKREFGVSLMEWRTLALLGGGDPLSLNELAKLAGLDKSQMSRVVAGLTERGLILRAVDSEDARGVRLSLTAGGRKVYAGLIHAANERNDAFLAALDAKERQILEGVLDKLAGAARGFIHAEGVADKPARKASKSGAARGGAANTATSRTREKRSGK
jgi:DNA-binding MarR family transcriptional regulator